MLENAKVFCINAFAFLRVQMEVMFKTMKTMRDEYKNRKEAASVSAKAAAAPDADDRQTANGPDADSKLGVAQDEPKVEADVEDQKVYDEPDESQPKLSPLEVENGTTASTAEPLSSTADKKAQEEKKKRRAPPQRKVSGSEATKTPIRRAWFCCCFWWCCCSKYFKCVDFISYLFPPAIVFYAFAFVSALGCEEPSYSCGYYDDDDDDYYYRASNDCSCYGDYWNFARHHADWLGIVLYILYLIESCWCRLARSLKHLRSQEHGYCHYIEAIKKKPNSLYSRSYHYEEQTHTDSRGNKTTTMVEVTTQTANEDYKFSQWEDNSGPFPKCHDLLRVYPR